MRNFGKRIQTVDFATKGIVTVTHHCTIAHSTFNATSCIAGFTFKSCGKLGVSPTQPRCTVRGFKFLLKMEDTLLLATVPVLL